MSTKTPDHTVNAANGKSPAKRDIRRSRSVSLAWAAAIITASIAGCGEGSGTAPPPTAATVAAHSTTNLSSQSSGTGTTGRRTQTAPTPSSTQPSTATPRSPAVAHTPVPREHQSTPSQPAGQGATRHARADPLLGALLAACRHQPNARSLSKLRNRAELCKKAQEAARVAPGAQHRLSPASRGQR
jgi:hypothetical protein